MADAEDEFLTDWTQTFRLSPTDDNIVTYLAGYAMSKMNGRFACSYCHAAYELSSARSQGELYCSDSSHVSFIQFKTFDWAKHGLLAPSRELYSLCTNIEKAVQMNMEKLICGRNVMRNLKDCLAAVIDFDSFRLDSVCVEHHQQQFDYLITLLLRVRIHHFLRIRNRELRQLEHARKLKVNRKATKVMHH